MELNQMRHFVTVAEELHFGRAARILNISQPPLSQSIRRLEDGLGVQLLNRTRRSVELTDAGRVFLAEARQTLLHAELARKLARREGLKTPAVRVGFVGPAFYLFLPEMLRRHRASYSRVEVRLKEGSSLQQVAQVHAGDLDIGLIVGGTEQIGDCETLLVESAQTVAAVPADGPLGHLRTVTLAELGTQPFILPPRKYARPSTHALALFNRIGVAPTVVQEAMQTNTVLNLVGAGIGCSLTTATATLIEPRNVQFLVIEDLGTETNWELQMIWRADLIGKAGLAFVDGVRRLVAEEPQLTRFRL